MSNPIVAVVMGSRTDWETLRPAAEMLDRLRIPHDVRVISAHRTPEQMMRFAEQAEASGFQVIIAAAGGAAHLPGMLASRTHLPVLGVPVQSKALSGLDSLLSIVQMPAGIPVGTLAIGTAGAINAALLAAAILALRDADLRARLIAYRDERTREVLADPDPRKPVAVPADSTP